MRHFLDKTPVLGAGLAWCMMNYFLMQVKTHRGLVSFIERHGINGRWLKPYEPYDIRITKLTKIMETKAHYQTDDEFLDDWNAAGEFLLKHVRAHQKFLKNL